MSCLIKNQVAVCHQGPDAVASKQDGKHKVRRHVPTKILEIAFSCVTASISSPSLTSKARTSLTVDVVCDIDPSGQQCDNHTYPTWRGEDESCNSVKVHCSDSIGGRCDVTTTPDILLAEERRTKRR